jgi:hypothetical protein
LNGSRCHEKFTLLKNQENTRSFNTFLTLKKTAATTRMTSMFYRVLADLVVLLHLFFIIFVVTGGFVALRWAWFALLHLPAAAWGAFIEFSGTICPLTPVENNFRRMAGQQGYSSGFIEHYLIPIIYPTGLTHEIQVLLGLFVITVNLVLYSFLFRRYLYRQ